MTSPSKQLRTTRNATAPEQAEKLAAGVVVEIRDEEWLVTHVARSKDGWKIRARGLTDYVRDNVATFYSAIDKIEVFDPTKVEVVADSSSQYRHSRLWMESALRNTAIPLYSQELSVATQMLADPLPYQTKAVQDALSQQNIRPRILLADAVGLGKTLEIGMILAELIRRGRGDRILVVTPKSVLEQFQQEMWTRFAIPLVRLDSQGIQNVRQKLPASRNPFTFFPRVIVSIDTLKSPKYRAQLEKVKWDAVVIDEIHNATNAGTQNNQLARTLAPTTESLILASATPHNGDPESFNEILRLLDPAAVYPDGSIDVAAAKRLIIRRHRNSSEVAQVVGNKWAKRAEPQNILVTPSAAEEAFVHELDSVWIHPADTPPCKDRLFPWTLVKAFLSSPAAILETLQSRLKRVTDANERAALERLHALALKLTPETSEKYQRLLRYLKEIGVKKNSSRRVVIFSERVATLKWLQEQLTHDLKLHKNAVAIMHGGLTDIEQMEIIDAFKREDTKIRILVTGDVASEGVNLHAQCHHLVHFDIPWSLIRIQQRNGRIDRYGQQHEPQIVSLLLDTGSTTGEIGDLRVLSKLITREHEAHTQLGDAAPLMGKHKISGEEDAIRDVLRGAQSFDDVVSTTEQILDHAHELESNAATDSSSGIDINSLLQLMATVEASEETAEPTIQAEFGSLYASQAKYLRDALDEAFNGVPTDSVAAGGVELVEHHNNIVEFTPPVDLRRRLEFLPQDYVEYRKLYERFSLATTPERGDQLLKAAREGNSEKSWPVSHFLGPLHPVIAWASDRALATMSRNQIPAISGPVDSPTVVSIGTLTNNLGHVESSSYFASKRSQIGFISSEHLGNPVQWLHAHGLGADAINANSTVIPEDIATLIADAISDVTGHMDRTKDVAMQASIARIAKWEQRVQQWEEKLVGVPSNSKAVKQGKPMIERERSLIPDPKNLRMFVRPLLVIVPE